MTQADQDAFRQQLLALGRRLKGDVTFLQEEALRKVGGEASGNLSNTPMHLADLGTDNYEQEVSLDLLANQEQTLEEIAAALSRLEAGTYGQCEQCGKEIGRERLQALPQTRYCIDCAREVQSQDIEIGRPGRL